MISWLGFSRKTNGISQYFLFSRSISTDFRGIRRGEGYICLKCFVFDILIVLRSLRTSADIRGAAGPKPGLFPPDSVFVHAAVDVDA